MSKRNENRPGYKETKVGWIPEDWEVVRLEEIGSFAKGSGITKSDLLEEGLPAIRYGEIYTDHNYVIKDFFSFISPEIALNSKKISWGDVLFAGSGETHEGIGKCVAYVGEGEAYAGGDIIILSLSMGNPEFFGYLLNQEAVNRQKSKYGQGASIVHIYASFLKNIIVGLPATLEEQTKIAEILCTWDKAIELVGNQIESKRQLKKGLMQQLLTGKIRFPGFGNPALKNKFPDGWQQFKIGEVLKRERDPVSVNPNQEYQEIGIKSHGKGIFYKEITKGSNIEKKSVFWVKPDCFIVNIVFAWEQAISKTTNAELGMITSHRFPMYRPTDSLLDLDYLVYLFKTSYGKHLLGMASPGGAGRNKTLGQDRFMKLIITLPPIDEQRNIGSLLNACDEEIKFLERRKTAMQNQRQGLMQKLLSGEVRVRVKE